MSKRAKPRRSDHPDFRSFYRLKKPCANCPFLRAHGIPLRHGRLKRIVAGLVSDDLSSFVCHKTVNYAAEDDPEGRGKAEITAGEVMCAGAAAYLQKIGRPTVGMRVAKAFGEIEQDHWREAMDLVVDQVE